MKSLVRLFIISFSAALLFLPATGHSCMKWVLYDDFESGYFDPTLWQVQGEEQGCTVTIEDGKAKFDHGECFPPDPGTLGCECILSFADNPESIVGVRVKVTVQSGAENILVAGIGSWIGKLGPEIRIWNELALSPDRILSYLWVNEEGKGTIYDLHNSSFKSPIEINQETFTITTVFRRGLVTYEVEGLGKTIFRPPQWMSKTDRFYKVLHTIGNGDFIVYMDDVQVLRKIYPFR